MKYFSGFCLCNEKELFSEYLEEGEFVVAGFSKGAQDALLYVLNTKERVDKLQLLSPAFFDYNEKIIELNIKAFKENKEKYIKNFLKKAGLEDFKYVCDCSVEELKKLFTFQWEIIKEIKNVKIEIFLGEYDRISASKKAYEFFKQFGDVYFIKKANHFLRS
jgi:hypothetical protein